MVPGTILTAGPQGAYIRSAPAMDAKNILATAKPYANAAATGKEQGRAPDRYYEIQSSPSGKWRGWVHESVVTVGRASTADDNKKATDLLLKIVENDKVIYANGIAIIKKLRELKGRNMDVTKLERRAFAILESFIRRQAFLQVELGKLGTVSGAYVVKKTDGIKLINGYLRGETLGVIPVVAGVIVVVVAALFIGVGIAGLLGAFDTRYGESETNLKESELLKKALENLKPEEAAEVRKDLEQQIDAGYDQGRKDEKSGGWFDEAKNLLLLGGMGLIAFTAINRR
jgi:hypothetical protein